jgi:hemerythrin-like domain-containing protein
MHSKETESRDRRLFMRTAGVTAGVVITAASLMPIPISAAEKKEQGEEDVSTNEDLMREHGILKRVLLVYDEIVHRISLGQEFPPDAVTDAANIIRKFIEDYHEKLEEDHLFPRFRQKKRLVDLVDTLYAQHQAGRRLTDRIFQNVKSLKTQEERDSLGADLRAFVRMYAPHEAREDTVLFPALHDIVSSHEYDAMGEQFERIERQTFGGDGFDIYLDKVAAIEKQLGIYDLAQFTPK